MSFEKNLLQFVPFESCVDPSFWHKFCKLKLEVDMLKENVRYIWGHYSPHYNRILNVDCTSFNKEFNFITNSWKSHGYHLNLNTLDTFKKYDKKALITEYGKKLKESIQSGKVLESPSLLATFILLTFADLKKYHFYYWFAFPAPSKPLYILIEPVCKLSTVLTDDQITLLFESHKELPYDQQGFFGITLSKGGIFAYCLKDFIELIEKYEKPLKEEDCIWGFIDPCEDTKNPGWLLRNFLYFVYIKCPKLREEVLPVICLRKKNNSIFLKVKSDVPLTSDEHWLGWETDSQLKLRPRFVDLSSCMNPTKLAEESVDLNLRLMKWRVAPELDLEAIKASKCLLVGAGTLGCNVARALLSWGVVNITFIDNGTVSYSNPVRQSLYIFEDCQKERSKAEAAASALKKIFPSVKSKGEKMTISMPGRGVNDIASVPLLEQLISEHDVVFLLTDTRESRWLPTLLSTKHHKISITAALGFDTYLVLRHGLGDSSSKLGCYFCNDVTAPGNSVQDRTLDQQCTVTRPGVSQIAAALAVELMVSILQHPNKGNIDTHTDTCLGQVPHSIRGFLSSHSQIMPSTPAFSQCTACSSKVIEEYNLRGLNFLEEVFIRANYLEDLTGLTELQTATTFSDILEFSDEDEM